MPRPSLRDRAHQFFDVVQKQIVKMAELPARMERNIKVLIGVIVGSFILIHYLNLRALRQLKEKIK